MGKSKHVLGLRLGPGHDTGAAIVSENQGELHCVAISEERLSREKNSCKFPENAVSSCLNEVGLKPDQLDAVVFEKTVWAYGAKRYEQISGPDWPYFNDPKERSFFESVKDVPCYYANHHLLHAATAWYTTSWPQDGETGCLLVIDGRGSTWGDGVGDLGGTLHDFDYVTDGGKERRVLKQVHHHAETQSIFVGCGRSIERVDVSLRSGIGFFYAWLTECVLGFGHMHAGKSMGLAGYGNQSRTQFPLIPDDVFNGIDTDLTEFIFQNCDRGLDFKNRQDEDPTSMYFADVASWGQTMLARAVSHLARYAIETTNARRLGYAGGVALNVVANRQIRDELLLGGSIEDFFVQPAASDTGLALGAALLGYYEILGGEFPFQKNQVYLGPTASPKQATEKLVACGGHVPKNLTERVADLLMDNKIVGWYDGRSEHGPRALGARSLLCWPRADWMKDHLNARVKHREPFRPFAPIVQEEFASEIFDADFQVPYMLVNTMIHDSHRELIPAVAHVDGSGRLQTVSRKTMPRLHALLGEIRSRDGLGVLLNTSFNDNGEPIVETPEDAIRCFNSTNIDALVCGNALISK